MNSHEDEAKRYEALKMEFLEKNKDNSKEYTQGKDKYIKEIIAMAMKER